MLLESNEPVRRLRGRFSIRDLLVLVVVVAAVLAWFLPAVLNAREAARQMTCSNNLKQIGLSLHNYHSAFLTLPSAMGGIANSNRQSGLLAITPFLEASPFYSHYSQPMVVDGLSYPAFGPVPWDKSYPPWREQFQTLRCPSDPNKQSTFALTNYLFSVGDLVQGLHQSGGLRNVRGAFAPGQFTRLGDIRDGTSNTIMMTETATKQTDYLSGQYIIDVPSEKMLVPMACLDFVDPDRPRRYRVSATRSDLGRGGNWSDGAGGYSLVHTILPPNGPSCAIEGTAAVDGVYTASSRHPGGCHILLCDGAVLMVADSIDAGDPMVAAPSTVEDASGSPIPSPYGVWGALGTRSAAEGDVGFAY